MTRTASLAPLIALIALCAGPAVHAEDQASRPIVVSGHREMLLQAMQSWNGKPYAVTRPVSRS